MEPSNRWIIGSLIALTVLSGLVFAAFPQIDLDIARLFYVDHEFPAAHETFLRLARRIELIGPAAILLACFLLALLKRLGIIVFGPNPRQALFLIGTFALIPGLIVNIGLKDHSHRPRPVQVTEFGGQDQFRPWYEWNGACVTNCSFVSGEASGAFWTVAPALIAPVGSRPVLVALAVLFGLSTSVLRMSFGGHFASDTILAGLLTLTLVLSAARLFLNKPPSGVGRKRHWD